VVEGPKQHKLHLLTSGHNVVLIMKQHKLHLLTSFHNVVLVMKQHKLHFTTWLKDLNLPVGEIEEEKMIHLLTSGPHSLVKS
jgi:hypothetical protein